jgi:hypothetical protein
MKGTKGVIRKYQRFRQKVPKVQIEGTKWKSEGTKGTTRRFKRVIRMCMYRSGKQKVSKGKSEGSKEVSRRK